MAKKLEGSPGDRLLQAANELFYAEGIHVVGIDRVIERAGVAKASLYSTYGSKDALVAAYLAGRAAQRRKRIEDRLALVTSPRDKLIGVFAHVEQLATDKNYRGCAFINANAETPRDPKSSVTRACDDQRAWTRALFTTLATELGAADPANLAADLAVLYDGAVVGAGIDRDPDRAARATAMAKAIIDAAAPRATN